MRELTINWISPDAARVSFGRSARRYPRSAENRVAFPRGDRARVTNDPWSPLLLIRGALKREGGRRYANDIRHINSGVSRGGRERPCSDLAYALARESTLIIRTFSRHARPRCSLVKLVFRREMDSRRSRGVHERGREAFEPVHERSAIRPGRDR